MEDCAVKVLPAAAIARTAKANKLNVRSVGNSSGLLSHKMILVDDCPVIFLIVGFYDLFYRQENICSKFKTQCDTSLAEKMEVKLKPRSITETQKQGKRKLYVFGQICA